MSKETYDAGYASGINWKYDNVPGGPFVYKNSRTHSGHPKYAERQQMEKESNQDHDDWMQGWRDGVAKRDTKEK